MSWILTKVKNMVYGAQEAADFVEFAHFSSEARLFQINKQTRSKECV